jgi:hypothetical protein
MDSRNVGTEKFGAATVLSSPPFATRAPVFAASVENGVAFAFADPAGGTRVATVDEAGNWSEPVQLSLSAVGMQACADLLVLGGLRLPDGALVLAGLEGRSLAWTAPLPKSGYLIHGPFPACAVGKPDDVSAVWVTDDGHGAATLRTAQLSKGGITGQPASVLLEARPLEIDLTFDGGAPVAVWTSGGRLGVYAARVAHGSAPVFQGLEGAASPRWVQTAGGMAWVAVGPKGLCARRIGRDLAPAGEQSELGEGFAPLLVAESNGRAALLARGARSFAGTFEVAGDTPREEHVYTAGAWVAALNPDTLALGSHAPLTPFGRYFAGAFTHGALLVVHGDAMPQLSAFMLS